MKKFIPLIFLLIFTFTQTGSKKRHREAIEMNSVKMGKGLNFSEKIRLKKLMHVYNLKAKRLMRAKKQPTFSNRPPIEYNFQVKELSDQLMKTIHDIESFYRTIGVFPRDIEIEKVKMRLPINELHRTRRRNPWRRFTA